MDYYSVDKVRWSEKDKKGIMRKEKLFKRQQILEIIRSYFKNDHFLEAEVPLLVSGTTPDIAIQSFAVNSKYLTTSTEYHIKRMIAGGFEKVFTLTKNFREYECDRYHNPEFTMLEWARAGASLEVIDNDAINIITALFNELYPCIDYLEYQNSKICLKAPWKILTFQEVFYNCYGIEIPDDYNISETVLLAQKSGMILDDIYLKEPGLLLSNMLDKAIKKIGFEVPVLIKKWPSAMTTSADCESLDSKWTTRTEIIIAGIEIADGFPFLCNYNIQKALFERSNAYRKNRKNRKDKKDNAMPTVTYDKKYLDMVSQGLCPGAGMALGIDRLCMLFTNSTDIKEVLCFAWDE
jgi:lysyl-tRNA synthetase class 2